MNPAGYFVTLFELHTSQRQEALRELAQTTGAGVRDACASGIAPTAVAAAPVPVTQWRSGLTELDRGWLEHEGDKTEWSRPEFDDSGWNRVDLGDVGPAQPGLHWYRRRVHFGSDHRAVRLLISGGGGHLRVVRQRNPIGGTDSPLSAPGWTARRGCFPGD